MTERGHRVGHRIAAAVAVGLVLHVAAAQAANGDELVRLGDRVCRLAAAEDCYRVAFDPGNRLRLTAGGQYDSSRAGFGSRFAVSLHLRGERPVDGPGDDFWKRDTRLAQAAVTPQDIDSGLEALQVSLVRGSYISYSTEPYLTLPRAPPRRLWFPFSPGLEIDVARLSGLPQPHRWGEIGVVRTSLLLDFVRNPQSGSTGYFGLDFAYDLVGLTPALDGALRESFESAVTPFSGGRFVAHHEWPDGLGWLDLRLAASRRLGLDTEWSTQLHGRAQLARTLVAVEDAPVSVVLDVAGDGSREASWAWSWRAAVGLEVGFELAR